jgi:hypothetical protein
LRAIEAEYTYWTVVESVEYVCAGAEIVHTLSEDKVTSVEDCGPEPAKHSNVAEPVVVECERIVFWEFMMELMETVIMGVAI